MSIVRPVAAALLLLVAAAGAEDDRWSRPATAERRQGDWVPLTCANCRPVSLVDQGAQASNSLPSVLTPPPRVEEARLLAPPPPPPDGLFQTAATGFLEQYTQQQPPPRPRKPLQFLQETSPSINRPQAQFLKSNGPLKPQSLLQEPSSEFQPPPQSNRQAQLINFNQQLLPEQPYLNQPLFLGPQFLAAPFFPQTSIPPQNVQQINPAQVQQQSPLSPNVLPTNSQNFQVPADRPVFLQQITAASPKTPSDNQQAVSQTPAPQLQYSVNGTDNQKDEGEREEVQLLYVPVETLNQRARNLGKQKSLVSNQGIAVQTVGTESNTFTSPGQNFAFSTRKPHFEDQNNFNTQFHTSKHQHVKQQFQQQLPPEDQEKFNSQIHTVREQFNVNQGDKFLQQPLLKNQDNFRLEAQNTKQYNRKPTPQFQQDQSFDSQFIHQQNAQFQPTHNSGQQQQHSQAQQLQQPQQRPINQFANFNQDIQQEQANFNPEALNSNQQLSAQFQNNNFEQLPPQHQQETINTQGLLRQQFNQQFANQNQQFLQQQIQANQQTFLPEKEQHYINQPITLGPGQPQVQQQFLTQQTQPQVQTQFSTQQTQPQVQQQFSTQQTQPQVQQQFSTQQTQPQVQQQFSTQQTQPQAQFNVPDPQTVAPATQTRQPIAHVSEPVTPTKQPSISQQVKSQRFRNSQHEVSKNAQHIQEQQFRRFPEDYQKQSEDGAKLSQTSNVGTQIQNHELRQNQQQFWSNQNIPNKKLEHEVSTFQADHHSVSSVAPPVSTSPQPRTTLAPNQPPLSVYMETTEDTKVNDVLRLLKNAKSIQVLDTIGPDSPQVFVGPSNLNAPSGYIKFELPYLNSLDSNRVERKVDKLPFFVAPLNFNPPPGYSKIPFPAPHVGSVVVSNDTVLRTAFHDKPFFNEPSLASTSEKYSDQYTLPAQISPISPQLPSLINSLQDEIFSGSSTPTYSSTTEATTTSNPTAYTTTSYRGRGSSRGSQRGSSAYTTSASPSRRPQARTRRPYDGRPHSRRQPVTTPTTTLEPSTEVPIQQYNPKPELAFNSQDYSVQNTASPLQALSVNNPSTLQPGITGTYYNEQFVASGLNGNQFSGQQLTGQEVGQQNIQQETIFNNGQNVQQYQQQNDFGGQVTAETTAVPTVATSEVQQEDQSYRNQRPTGSRKDPLRQHQRFRGRQRLTTTTTTENYEEPSEPTQDHFTQHTSSGMAYQNAPNRHHLRNHDHNRLVENTHFTASLPRQTVQTERADVGLQTTEKVFPVQNEQQFVQQPVDNVQVKSQINTQFQAPVAPQGEEQIVNQANLQHQFQLAQAQFSQQNQNIQQLNAKSNHQVLGFDYVPATQQNIQYTNDNFQQGRFAQTQHHQQDNINQFQPDRPETGPVGQVYFDQQNQQERQPAIQDANSQYQYGNDQTPQSQIDGQSQVEGTIHGVQNIQAVPVSTTGQVTQHVTEVSNIALQEAPIQTQQPEVSPSQPQLEDSHTIQHNQQRLVKYNRPQGRTQTVVESSVTDEQTSSRRGQYHFQSEDNNTPSTSELATTKASLVRVRGRVRNRQRASTRVTTTTETPNYPSTYLSRQRNEKEEAQEYVPKKRVSYSNRQSVSSLRHNINKGEENEQSFTEPNYASTDRQSTADRYVDNTEVATTTESSGNTPSRRYQHILNRNKIRRVRPTNTPSTSGSGGTTKFLLPTTQPPMTRLPASRGRIRKPVNLKSTTTTEYPQVNNNWNERDNFAPSAGSNEILEPLYQTKDKSQQNFGFQRTPIAPLTPQKSTPKPIAPVAGEEDDDYWNQAVTIQQSTSFDFKPEGSPVTPPSFQENRGQGTFAPVWNGQIELQDGNYYDIFSQQQIAKNVQDQTPFSSDHQKIVYKDIKSRIPVGKENQYSEKSEVQKQNAGGEEHVQDEKVYPVYREVVNPAETLQEETSQVVADVYEGERNGLVHEKDASVLSENTDERKVQYEESASLEPGHGDETKEGAIKRKIIATHPGKKGRRRGSWVRVRVRKPQDVFETAESQNVASLSGNAIQAVTKSVGEKSAWTPEPEPNTEAPQTTVTPEVSEEPVETINFEDALKNMLKEFITNPEEERKEDAEVSASVANENGTSVELKQTEDSSHSDIEHEKSNGSEGEKEELEKESQEERKSDPQDHSVHKDEAVKTVLPEVTTELFTQEPTTIFQPVENAETTIEPEITTSNEQTKKTRVLGTSTTTQISLETEICYRGRCVKTKKGEADIDLLTME